MNPVIKAEKKVFSTQKKSHLLNGQRGFSDHYDHLL